MPRAMLVVVFIFDITLEEKFTMTNKEKLIQMLTKDHIIVDDFTEQCGHNFTGLLNSNMLVYLDLYNSGVKYFIVIPRFINTEKQLVLDYNQLPENTRLYVDYISDEDMPGVQLYLQYSSVCTIETLNKTLNSKYNDMFRILSNLLTDNRTEFPI